MQKVKFTELEYYTSQVPGCLLSLPGVSLQVLYHGYLPSQAVDIPRGYGLRQENESSVRCVRGEVWAPAP